MTVFSFLGWRVPAVAAPRIVQVMLGILAENARRALLVAGEIALLLWTLLALAFSLLLVVGCFY
ncbi:MAG: hypothetical protein ABSF94_10680 [Steroidobacteraceae bacterium]|jgi:hypothetical protein